jgi:peptide chain release factor subunit 1
MVIAKVCGYPRTVSARNDLTPQALRSLAGTRAEQKTVLSLYLNLDPERFATARARASEIDSLLDGAHREIEAGERPHSELMALRAALERAREILTDEDQSWSDEAHAVAVFISTPLQLEQLLRLPHALESSAVVADEPFIAPLTELAPASTVCVALIDERHARILQGPPERLRRAGSISDPVHGRHDQGGWSQARYQRSQQEDVDAHLRHVARQLHDLLTGSPYDQLLIACTEPLWPRVLAHLQPDVRARLHDERLALDVPDAGIEEIVAATDAVLEREHAAHEEQVLAELREHLARNSRAAAGPEAVLLALVERRVQVLLYERGLQLEGVLCPRCGWMGIEAQSCPNDGGDVQSRDNVVEDAVQAAINQDAEVIPLRDRDDLRSFQGIAATLRF